MDLNAATIRLTTTNRALTFHIQTHWYTDTETHYAYKVNVVSNAPKGPQGVFNTHFEKRCDALTRAAPSGGEVHHYQFVACIPQGCMECILQQRR